MMVGNQPLSALQFSYAVAHCFPNLRLVMKGLLLQLQGIQLRPTPVHEMFDIILK